MLAFAKKTKVYNCSKKDSEKVGASKVIGMLQSEGVYAVGRTAVRNIPMKSQAGKRVADRVEEHGKGRGSAGGSKKRPTKPSVAESVHKDIGINAATAVN